MNGVRIYKFKSMFNRIESFAAGASAIAATIHLQRTAHRCNALRELTLAARKLIRETLKANGRKFVSRIIELAGASAGRRRRHRRHSTDGVDAEGLHLISFSHGKLSTAKVNANEGVDAQLLTMAPARLVCG